MISKFFLILIIIVNIYAEEFVDNCKKVNIYESIECYEELNSNLEDELNKLNNSSEKDYKIWEKKVKKICENEKKSFQGAGLGLIKLNCYYTQYNARLFYLKEK